MTLNCSVGDTAQIVAGPGHNRGKVLRVIQPHPVAKGYRNPDGSVVQCHMWQVDPPVLGGDGLMYDAVPDEILKPFAKEDVS